MFARILPLTLFSVLIGCKGCKDDQKDTSTPIDDTGDSGVVDNDGDGVPAGEDCDDDDAMVGTGSTWYQDADGDGYGVDDATTTACEQPSGYAAVGGDCDDGSEAFHPGATEDCTDPTDYNCDGSVGYEDLDGDGTPACEDCDDDNAGANPDAVETCDDVDNDCDGSIDEEAIGAGTWYTDTDADGYGVDEGATTSCDQPAGTAAASGDCDDADPAYNPGATEDDCADPNDYNCDGSTGYDDEDGDGWAACEECDDSDAEENPDKVEVCDGDDDDCDGEIDEDDAYDASSWYADTDGDSYGDPTVSTTACSAPEGYVADNTDCDDLSATAYPDRAETCDGEDNDCDGEIDEEATDAGTWYADTDGDGFGDPATTVTDCDPGEGYSADGTDCDDGNSAEFPGADEVCDGDDDDCDGEIDEDGAVDADTWYGDGDGDGYGADATTAVSCEAPEGYVAYGGDCDDADTAYNPGASETDCADPNDYNCDGFVGYADDDGDGWAACEECDDGDASIYPGADETCDDVDNDCDGATDESGAGGSTTWYADDDGDGYGDAGSAVSSCDAPEGYVADATDCDDGDATIHPDGSELCDGVDNDCDGATDEDSAFDAETWYADEDGDGYGDAASSAIACDAPDGYVADATDCDDAAADVNPEALETCDELDNDCDGATDEDATDALTWYYDGDSDTYGDDAVEALACERPAKHRRRGGDCDDTDSSVNPAASETCDGVDEDCDGSIDEDASDAGTWYADEDGDGYGDPSASEVACDAPADHVADATDCDDADDAVSPAGSEVCNDRDDDCDGSIDEGGADAGTWYADDDGDGFGDASSSTTACDAPAGYVPDGTDCDDADGTENPDADEVCDGDDDDCDGAVDEDDAVDESSWYADEDGDGYGDPTDSTAACEQPDGYVADDTDCDDGDALVSPSADEVCDDVDNDCDDRVDERDAVDAETWYADDDGDGYGDPADSAVACDAPTGTVGNDDDCDDGAGDVYPGADEVCDDVDNDCDSSVDEDAIDAPSWYTDEDGDGYGTDESEVVACDAPSGTVSLGGDCDDADSSRNPGETDECNGVDDDCDGELDEAVVEGRFLMSSDTTYDAVLSINPDDASATEVSSLTTSTPVSSVAVGPDGTAYLHNSGILYKIDPCTGELTVIGESGRGTVCGLTFDDEGTLYGLDRNSRSLVSFDTSTGAGTNIGSLGFRVAACGLAYDCTNDRIVGADASTNSLFTVDPSTGAASDFVSTGLTLTSVGLEYDPRTQSFLLSTETSLYDVDYGTGDVASIGTVSPGSNIDDLVWFPECPAD